MSRIAKGLFSLCRPSLWPSLAMGVGVSIENLPVLKSKHFSTVLDVGANRGQFSLAARVANPAATIEAFEPVAEAAQIYRRIFDGTNGVTLHEVAAGAEETEVPIRVSPQTDGSSMIVPLEGKERNVRVTRLDTVIKEIRGPALLKLDIQGYELEALKGAAGILPYIDDVLCEVTFIAPWDNLPEAHEIIAFMRESGFQIASVRNVTGLAGLTAIADIHFVRSSGYPRSGTAMVPLCGPGDEAKAGLGNEPGSHQGSHGFRALASLPFSVACIPFLGRGPWVEAGARNSTR